MVLLVRTIVPICKYVSKLLKIKSFKSYEITHSFLSKTKLTSKIGCE